MFVVSAAVVLLVLLAEVAARWSGVLSMPLYLADPQLGYVPRPDQQGAQLHKNAWVVNEKSMGTSSWSPNGARDLLLLGDSLVWGGDAYDQPDRLGPQMEQGLPDWRVWPAAANSWAVLNEIAYLDHHPDVQAEADVVVWVLNTADLGGRAQWANPISHPLERPASAVVYLLQRHVLRDVGHLFDRLKWAVMGPGPGQQRAQVVDAASVAALERKLQQLSGKPVLFVLVPHRAELGEPTPRYLEFRAALVGALGGCCGLLELRDDPGWTLGLYRDEIHPTVQGNRLLAARIVQRLVKDDAWRSRQ
ncbi:hypothetical protein ASF43_24430 [Pseudorhodoferax sp. Leaf267]|nr:hypothetical protein ASF43_24430 [Pseudorhodoferax sp. Leaf267]